MVALPMVAAATSSGSFTASVDNTACTISGTDGILSAPLTGEVYLTPTTGLQVRVPTNTDVVISPSLVTGLYTDLKVGNTSTSSLQNVGLFVQVIVEPAVPLNGGAAVSIAPNTTATGGTGQSSLCALPTDAPTGSATSCVIYDQRFIQVTAGFLSGLSTCTSTDNCFELTESTLSAHDFNWYVNLPTSGAYNVIVKTNLMDTGSTNSTNGSVAACAGPGTVTVTQVNNFNQNTPAQF